MILGVAVRRTAASEATRGVDRHRAGLRTLVALVGMCAIAAPAYASDALPRFDPDLLRSRGLAPELAEYFSQGPRFNPGRARVSLVVNGTVKGDVVGQFDAFGHLCLTRALLECAGLVIPDDLPKTTFPTLPASSGPDPGVIAPETRYCHDYQAAFAQTQIRLVPNEARVELLVPQQALRPSRARARAFSGGGAGAVLNYDLDGSRRQHGSWSDSAFFGQTEAGFNALDWIVRSRQSIIGMGDSAVVRHAAAYAQRTWATHGATLQIGQIDLANAVIGGASLHGFQILPEAALHSASTAEASVEGIAQSQARVEVRQAGRQIYSTLVPPGRFRLTNLRVVSNTAELTVIVTEAEGAQHEFTVPATSIMADAPVSAQGLSLAFGMFRSAGKDFLGTAATRGWRIGRPAHAAGTALLSDHYQAVAAALTITSPAGPAVNARLHVSRRVTDHAHGAQASVRVSGRLNTNLSASVSSSVRSAGFRHHLQGRTTRRQCGASDIGVLLNYAIPSFGSVSLGYAQSFEFGAGQRRRQVTGSLSSRFRGASFALDVRCDVTGSVPVRTSTYVSVNIPFGRSGASSHASMAGSRVRTGVRVHDSIGERTRYSASVQRSYPDGRTTADFGLSRQTGYAGMSAGLSVAPQALSYWGKLSGGLVLHEEGVSFSPSRIGDTFGIVSTGNVPGVRITTPDGPVRTDGWGRALLPSLLPYTDSSVQIVTKTLPRNADVDNGYKAVRPGRGSVVSVRFNVTTVRRVLLDVTISDATLRHGMPVVDREGNLVATAIDDRHVFLPHAEPDQPLWLELAKGHYCELSYTLPDDPVSGRSYERAKARCSVAAKRP